MKLLKTLVVIFSAYSFNVMANDIYKTDIKNLGEKYTENEYSILKTLKNKTLEVSGYMVIVQDADDGIAMLIADSELFHRGYFILNRKEGIIASSLKIGDPVKIRCKKTESFNGYPAGRLCDFIKIDK